MADAAKSEHSRKKFSISFLRIPSCTKPNATPAIQQQLAAPTINCSVARDYSSTHSLLPRAASPFAGHSAPVASASKAVWSSGSKLSPSATCRLREREGSCPSEQQRRTSAGSAAASASGDERNFPTRCAAASSSEAQRKRATKLTFQCPESPPQETAQHRRNANAPPPPPPPSDAPRAMSSGEIARRVRARKLGAQVSALFQRNRDADVDTIETVRHCEAHVQLQQPPPPHPPAPHPPHSNPPLRRVMEKPSIEIQPSIDDFGSGGARSDVINEHVVSADVDLSSLSASACNLLSFNASPDVSMSYLPMRLRRTTVSASERYLEELRRNVDAYNGSGGGGANFESGASSGGGIGARDKSGAVAALDAEPAYDSQQRSRRYTLGERSSPNLRVSSPLARSPLAQSRGSFGSSGQMADAPLPPSLNHVSAAQLEMLREQSSKALSQILRELCPNFKFEQKSWFFKRWLKRRKAHKCTFDAEGSSSPARQQRSKSRTPPQTHAVASSAPSSADVVTQYPVYPVFGLSLEQLQRIYRRPLPPAVLALMRHLLATCEREDALGIFRRAGNRGHVRALRAALESSGDGSVTEPLAPEFNVYDVADVLKQFFREIPDCLLTSKLSEAVINIYLSARTPRTL